MSVRDASRARWRADLHEFGSAALRSAGLDAMADVSDREVATQRAYADLMTELAAAKADGNSAVLRDVKTRVVAFRKAWRTSDAPSSAGAVNHISEPSDAELVESGY